jgi:hypothetical protein
VTFTRPAGSAHAIGHRRPSRARPHHTSVRDSSGVYRSRSIRPSEPRLAREPRQPLARAASGLVPARRSFSARSRSRLRNFGCCGASWRSAIANSYFSFSSIPGSHRLCYARMCGRIGRSRYGCGANPRFVALSVEHCVVRIRDLAVGFLRDTGFDAAYDQGDAEPVCVVAPIGRQRFLWARRQSSAQRPLRQAQDRLAILSFEDPDNFASPASHIRLSSDSRFRSPTLACPINRTRRALQAGWLQAKGLAFIKEGELASLRSSQEGTDWNSGRWLEA